VLKKQGGASCGQTANLDTPGMGLRIAAYLLTRPTDAARYVQVFDGGLIPATGGGGYDTHSDHNVDSLRNLNHTMGKLMSIINEPGEKDPGKIDLDDTLVHHQHGVRAHAVRAERQRAKSPSLRLRDGDVRWAHRREQRGIYGAIGADADAKTWLTPVEMRAAVSVAAGIWPFEPESFAVGDIRDTSTEADAAMFLKEEVLGHGV
jgi:hypothetical protein